jgi:hypothetical protein
MTTDKYCDCAQGRWPCTCMPRGPRAAFDVKQKVAAEDFLKEISKCPGQVEVTGLRFDDSIYAETAKAIKGRPGYWERLATDKAKLFALKCAEFDALDARLRVYQGVAVIGWAGFILALLGV